MPRKFISIFTWIVMSLVIAINSASAQISLPNELQTFLQQAPPPLNILIAVIDNNITVLTPVEGIQNLTRRQLENGSVAANFTTTANLVSTSTGSILPAGAYQILVHLDNRKCWRALFLDSNEHLILNIPINLTQPEVLELSNPDEPLTQLFPGRISMKIVERQVNGGTIGVCLNFVFGLLELCLTITVL